nr:hypothetical protein GW17_00021365 [Ipomoea batatas]
MGFNGFLRECSFLLTSTIAATAIDTAESTRPTPTRCSCVTPEGRPVSLAANGTKTRSYRGIRMTMKIKGITGTDEEGTSKDPSKRRLKAIERATSSEEDEAKDGSDCRDEKTQPPTFISTDPNHKGDSKSCPSCAEMRPPTIESKKLEPMKFVSVLAEPERSKCIFSMKYSTMLTMFATNPMLSIAPKPA